MKNKRRHIPAGHSYTILKQVCNLIPGGLAANCMDWAKHRRRKAAAKCHVRLNLQLADFLGHNANAVRWQIWIGLLVHLLLRYLAYLHAWAHSFTRLFTVLRASLWRRWHLGELLDGYGTAKPPGRLRATPELAYLPGFA